MNRFRLSFSIVSLALLCVTFFSCKDDKDEVPKSTISFDGDTKEVNESDGIIPITIKFDKPLAENTTLKFTTSGTATEFVEGGSTNDYKIPGGKTLNLNKGATSATINIEWLEDYPFEITSETITYETLIITLTNVTAAHVQLGTAKEFTLKAYEDDTIVILDWDAGAGTRGDVDMDLLVWYLDEGVFKYLGASDAAGSAKVEAINIPGGFTDGTYGFSYTYYSGTSDDLNYEVTFSTLRGKLEGESEDVIFNGHYSLANLNKYDDEDTGVDPLIAQQVSKTGINYDDFTALESPATGSRTSGRLKPVDLSKLRKGNAPGVPSMMLKTIIHKK